MPLSGAYFYPQMTAPPATANLKEFESSVIVGLTSGSAPAIILSSSDVLKIKEQNESVNAIAWINKELGNYLQEVIKIEKMLNQFLSSPSLFIPFSFSSFYPLCYFSFLSSSTSSSC